MRTVSVTVAGSVYALPVNFKAIEAVDARAGDPWAMVIRYTTGKPLSLIETVNVIVAGVLQADPKADPSALADHMVDAGAAGWAEVARKYVFALCEGKSDQPADVDEAAAKK